MVATLTATLFPSTAVDCGTLPNPINGRVNHTAGTTLGQTATYSCNAGYNLVGNSTRTCQATGVWSGSAPTCPSKLFILSIINHQVRLCIHDVFLHFIVVDCGPLPDPANGHVSTTRTIFGQTATYSCNTGYRLVGNSIRVCQATGSWSGSAPTCQGTLLLSGINYQV